MKLQSFGFSRSGSFFQNSRVKLRWMEWLIAIFFVVSLLVASGIFIKASNAANLKSERYAGLSATEINTIPGSMRVLAKSQAQTKADVSKVRSLSPGIAMENDDSCELKEKP